MPGIDDCDPIQDAKHARETAAIPAPTLGELYRAWLAANDEWAAASAVRKEAEAKEAQARIKAGDLEQAVGAAALDGVQPERVGGNRSGWVVMGGRLYFVAESTSGSWDGHRNLPVPSYKVEPQTVRKLAVD